MIRKNFVKIYFKKTDTIMRFIKRNKLNQDPRIEREVYAFTFANVDYVFARTGRNVSELNVQIKRKLKRRFGWYDLEQFDKRVDFYMQFMNGKKPRAEYIPIKSDFSDHASRVFGAFSDILYNSSLIDDYDNASIFGIDMFSSSIYFEKTRQILQLLVDLILALE